MNIFLIGFMGSGKSHVGKILAERLQATFTDMDQAIEEAANISIRKIFETKGSSHFRLLEQQALKQLANTKLSKHHVISTGGGAPCFFDNIQFMNKKGITFYLDVKPNLLAERLENEIDKRPLLKNLKNQTLVEYISSMLDDRRPFYEQATHHIHIDSNTLSFLPDIIRHIKSLD